MRLRILPALVILLALLPLQAKATGGLIIGKAAHHHSMDTSNILKVHKACRRGGYRTSCDPYERRFFFPPKQFKVTRCEYYEYIKLGRRKYSDRTYRCWRRKPAYKKRRRHAW